MPPNSWYGTCRTQIGSKWLHHFQRMLQEDPKAWACVAHRIPGRLKTPACETEERLLQPATVPCRVYARAPDMAEDQDKVCRTQGQREPRVVIFHHLESESLVEGWVQCLPVHLGLIFLLLVWEEEDFDIRV